ncbi:MAG TPA: flagellar motor protein MotB [Alphaproteobacteria bacterium]|mgnify:CR=1 FL=1|nr:MAG: OmpA family protein [Rhodospirillales bacterium]HOO82083.1 flagellar motor protein MotB [Alphaproteobacteria bacterium]
MIPEQKNDEDDEIEAGSYLSPAHNKRLEGREDSTALWLITFTDIMALMLTFFVLLYSMSVPEEEEWENITSGLQSQFTKTFSTAQSKGPQDTISIDKIDFSKAQDLSYLSSVLANVISKDERLKNIVLIPQSDHLIASVPEDLLFESGRASVSAKGKQVLFSLGNTMSRIKNRIEIIGHTDPRPIQNTSGPFASNWELSLARAGSVATVLENAGYQRPLTVRGLSSARYDSLPEEMSEEQRLSLARRVDIIIMEDDGNMRQFMPLDLPP